MRQTVYVIRDASGFEHDMTTDEDKAYELRDMHDELYDGTFYVHEEDRDVISEADQ